MEEGVYLLKLRLENIHSFNKQVVLDLSDGKRQWKKWTILLGNNGTGKSTILQCIAALEQVEVQSLEEDFSVVSARQYIPWINYDNEYRKVLLGKGERRFSIEGFTTLSKSKNSPDLKYWFREFGKSQLFVNGDPLYNLLKIYGYGATRHMNTNSLTESNTEGSNLFDNDVKLINAEEWLLQLDYSASKPSPIQDFASKRRDQVKEVLLELLPDIEAIRFTEPTKENLKSNVEFRTPYGWVTIHQLSLGYKTMVAWMVDLAARMFERYSEVDNPLEQPAIVLVDEIDLHMHPKWQRKIFDYLSEKFPKTQFIVTAHSPLIVQSAPKDANIVLLRREGDHVVIDNDIQSVHNWRIDQILNSDLFGNISQRSPETEEWMNKREELLKKDNLDEEEKALLKKLNKKAHALPTAGNSRDIEAMEIIREAADYLKAQKA